MGFLDDLFLGKGPKLETRSLPTIDPTQRDALNELIGRVRGTRAQPYGGQFTTPLTGAENTSLAALEERSRMLATQDPTLQAAGTSLQGQLDYGKNTADATDFYRTNVEQPLLENFERDVLPRIGRSYGGNSFFTSERQASEGLARQDLLQSLTGAKSNIELDQYNRSRERALQAASLAPGVAQAETNRSAELRNVLAAQSLPRDIQDRENEARYADFLRQIQEDDRTKALLAQLGLTPTIENIGMTNPGSPGLVNIIAGGAAQGLGEAFGDIGGDFWRRIFGDGIQGTVDPTTGEVSTGPPADEFPQGGAQQPTAGQAGTNVPVPIPGLPQPGVPTPGGTVTITEGDGTVANQQPNRPFGGGGAAAPFGAAAGIGGALAGAAGAVPAGTATITEAGGQIANQVARGAAGAAAGGGAAGGGAAGAGGAASSGAVTSAVSTALGLAGGVVGAVGAYDAAIKGDKKNAAISGAAAGASVGSVVPVIGTVVGAAIGAIVGLAGASLGDKQQASEAAYGSYKKTPASATIRNWTENQANGAMFEAIKSHSKSGGTSKFEDVGDLYRAFGVSTNDYRGLQQNMNMFIENVINVAQQTGGLPDDASLEGIDGQQFFFKVVAPAMAAKIEETTGKPRDSNSWSIDRSEKPGAFHGMFADITDYMFARRSKNPTAAQPQQPQVSEGVDLSSFFDSQNRGLQANVGEF